MKIQNNTSNWSKRVLSISVFLIVMLSLPILNVQAQQWEKMSEGITTNDLIHIWNNAENELFISSKDTTIHYDGNQWTTIHYDGNQWTTITEDSSWNFNYSLSDSWTTPDYERFAIGCDNSSYYRDRSCKQISHYNGANWTEMDKGKSHSLEGIWGSAKDDVFAVGEMGAIFHYDGHQWTKMTRLTSKRLYDVWGSAGDDVFAIGKAGTMLHYDGSQWTTMNSGTGQTLRAIWGTAENNVFAVGDKGRILHYDGNQWTVMVRSTENLRSIWGNAANNVFAVGEAGTILHYDGCHWTEMDSSTNHDIYDIKGNTEPGIVAVGENGLILHLTDIPETTIDENLCEEPVINTEPVLEIEANFSELYKEKGEPHQVLRAYRGDTIRFTATATDQENNHFVFGLGCDDQKCSIPDGASIDPNTGVFTWTPEEKPKAKYSYWQDEYFSVTVTETDGEQINHLSDEETIVIRVLDISTEEQEPPFTYDIIENIHTLTTDEGNSNNCACQNPLLSMTKTKLSHLFSVITSGSLPTNFWKDENSESLVIINNDSTYTGEGIYHYDGNTWRSIDTSEFYYGIWGHSANELFIVGMEGTILHYDGNQWMGLNSGTEKDLYNVWGTSANNVFAVGWGGIILHYDGSDWTKMDSSTQETLFSVWGTSENDVFAVGMNGTILHYDGNQWATMTSSTEEDIFGVLGCSGNDVYAVGNRGIILHYDGTQWQEKSILGLLWDGLWEPDEKIKDDNWSWIKKDTANHLTVMESNTTLPLKSVWANSAQDVFAVGGQYGWPEDRGIILHYDGSQWTEMFNSNIPLNAIWGSSENDVFVVGGERWSDTKGIILHYDGSQWIEMFNGHFFLDEIWGTAKNEVSVKAQNGAILHYDGIRWAITESSRKLWGNSSGQMFTLGKYDYSDGKNIFHYDGNQWTETFNSDTRLNAIWGSSENDVFVVGDDGVILHYDGQFWRNMGSGITNDLHAIWGSSENDVFVVGDEGIILHYDGSQWSEMFDAPFRLDEIWGNAGNDVFVSDNNTILHYDGEQWTTIENATIHHDGTRWTTTPQNDNAEQNVAEEVKSNSTFPEHQEGILLDNTWRNIKNEGLAIGCQIDIFNSYPSNCYDNFNSKDVIFHYDGNQWVPVASGVNSLHDITGVDNEAFIVGSNGTILHYDFNKEVPESTSEMVVNNGRCELTINTAPILNPIDAQQIVQGETFSFIATAQDAEGDSLTYALSDAPTGASIEANTGLITWTPAQIGDFSLTIVVSEEGTTTPLSDEETITISVVATPPIPHYILTTGISGQGSITGDGIDCGSDCFQNYSEGTRVPLLAIPHAGSNFTEWGSDCTDTNDSITLTMDEAKHCTANFALIANSETTTTEITDSETIDENNSEIADSETTTTEITDSETVDENNSEITDSETIDLEVVTEDSVTDIPLDAMCSETYITIESTGNASDQHWAAKTDTLTYNGPTAAWKRLKNMTAPNRPLASDVVRIKKGHKINTVPYITVKALCIEDGATLESADNQGSELNILAIDFIENKGTIQGQNGANENANAICTERQHIGTLNCAQPGAGITLQSTRFHNEGIIVAGAGGTGQQQGAVGGWVDIWSDTLTNTSNADGSTGGIIRAGNGGDILGTQIGQGGRGGHVSLWGDADLQTQGEVSIQSGNGGHCNPEATAAQTGGDGGLQRLNGRQRIALQGTLTSGTGGQNCEPLGTNGRTARITIDPTVLSISGENTQIQGGDIAIYGGNDWTLDLSNLSHQAITATGDITLAVGEGGTVKMPTDPIMQAAGKVQILADNIELDDNLALSDIIKAQDITVGPSQILREVALTGPTKIIGEPETTLPILLKLANSGPETDTYALTVTDLADWPLEIPASPIEIAGLGHIDLALTVTLPANRSSTDMMTVTATSINDPAVTASVEIQVMVALTTDDRDLISTCPTTGSINQVCRNDGQILTDANLGTAASIAGGQLAGTINNQGLISQVTVQSEAVITGGQLTGYITNHGTIADFEFVGARIIGGTLAGTVMNNSQVGGTFKDVHLAPNTLIIGGQLQGEIIGDIEAPAQLDNVTIKANSHLVGVVLGDNVSLSNNVTVDDGTQPLDDIAEQDSTEDNGTQPLEDIAENDSTDSENSPIAALPALLSVIAINTQGVPVETDALFAGGISVNTAAFHLKTTVTAADLLDIRGRLFVAEQHSGQPIDIIVVVGYQPTPQLENAPYYYFMLDPDGQIETWDVEMGNLIAFQTLTATTQPIEVPIYQGRLDITGILNIYFGYRLTDSTIIYSPESLDMILSNR